MPDDMIRRLDQLPCAPCDETKPSDHRNANRRKITGLHDCGLRLLLGNLVSPRVTCGFFETKKLIGHARISQYSTQLLSWQNGSSVGCSTLGAALGKVTWGRRRG